MPDATAGQTAAPARPFACRPPRNLDGKGAAVGIVWGLKGVSGQATSLRITSPGAPLVWGRGIISL